MSDVTIPEAEINAMCLTWRHDFGLVLDEEPRAGYWGTASGMTERQREALRRDMRQLYQHHILPAISADRERAAEAVYEVLATAGFPTDSGTIGRAVLNAIRSSHE